MVRKFLHSVICLFSSHSASDQRTKVWRLPGKTLPLKLMTLSACEIFCGCNVLQVLIHPNYSSRGTKAGELSPPWWMKIAMACVRIILRDESQTVGNSLLHYSSPTLNSTNQQCDLNLYSTTFFFINTLIVFIFKVWNYINVIKSFYVTHWF